MGDLRHDVTCLPAWVGLGRLSSQSTIYGPDKHPFAARASHYPWIGTARPMLIPISSAPGQAYDSRVYI